MLLLNAVLTVRAGKAGSHGNKGWEAFTDATIRALRGQLTPTQSKTARSPLPDEQAYASFNKTCATPGSESLRLYKLYVRMQGFAPLTE